MNEIEFKNWLAKKQVKTKVISDIISRLKRIERELENCDIDEEYRSDKCNYVLSLFLKKGNNSRMEKYYNTSLPVGKTSMNTYKYSLNMYIKFLNETTSNN